MNYSEGTSYALTDGSWLKIDVEVSNSDVDHLVLYDWAFVIEDGSPSTRLPSMLRFQLSSHLCRKMILQREVAEFGARAVKDKARGAELRQRIATVTAEGDALREKVGQVDGMVAPE